MASPSDMGTFCCCSAIWTASTYSEILFQWRRIKSFIALPIINWVPQAHALARIGCSTFLLQADFLLVLDLLFTFRSSLLPLSKV